MQDVDAARRVAAQRKEPFVLRCEDKTQHRRSDAPRPVERGRLFAAGVVHHDVKERADAELHHDAEVGLETGADKLHAVRRPNRGQDLKLLRRRVSGATDAPTARAFLNSLVRLATAISADMTLMATTRPRHSPL